MSGRSVETNLRLSLGRAGLITMGLQDFAAKLIAHVSAGGTLDDNALASIRASCVLDLKNSDATGPSIEQQAEVFRKAIDDLEKLVDGAIQRGRQPQQP